LNEDVDVLFITVHWLVFAHRSIDGYATVLLPARAAALARYKLWGRVC